MELIHLMKGGALNVLGFVKLDLKKMAQKTKNYDQLIYSEGVTIKHRVEVVSSEELSQSRTKEEFYLTFSLELNMKGNESANTF